jgi:hypothetical protein
MPAGRSSSTGYAFELEFEIVNVPYVMLAGERVRKVVESHADAARRLRRQLAGRKSLFLNSQIVEFILRSGITRAMSKLLPASIISHFV